MMQAPTREDSGHEEVERVALPLKPRLCKAEDETHQINPPTTPFRMTALNLPLMQIHSVAIYLVRGLHRVQTPCTTASMEALLLTLGGTYVVTTTTAVQ